MKASLILRVLSLAMAALGLLIFLTFVELPGTLLWRAISNFGHLPLFGLLALLLFGLSVSLLGGRVQKRWWHYLIALVTTVTVGAASEYTQIAGPRDADLWDLMRDFGGALSFLCLYLLRDDRLALQTGERTGKMRVMASLVALVIISAGIAPPVLWAAAYWHRNSAFPMICEFESQWESPFLTTKEAELGVVTPPVGWPDPPGNHVAKVTFKSAAYSEITVMETCPDWRGFDRFSFDAYSRLDSAVFLTLRIEDTHHNDRHDDRFNRRIRISPGLNEVAIALSDIKDGPKVRKMDMAVIRIFSLFAHQPPEPFTLYFDNFRLQ